MTFSFFGVPVARVRRHRGKGDRGAKQTLGRMVEITKRAAVHPNIVTLARGLVGVAGRRDKGAQIRAVRLWIEAHTKWLPDPLGNELLVPPELMLERIKQRGTAPGDCDDIAMLSAALLRAVGIPTKFTAVSFHAGHPLRHVFPQAYDGERWHALDTTRPPWSSARPHRGVSLEVR